MNDDLIYLLRRACEEQDLAAKSSSSNARGVHARMAAEYARRVDELTSSFQSPSGKSSAH